MNAITRWTATLATVLIASASGASAATLVGTPCGGAGCDLYARAGAVTLPATTGPTSVPIWFFSTTSAGAAALPGPLLTATVGDTVTITLHNALPHAVSLSIPQLGGAPDTAGAAASGGTKVYTFTADRAGVMLYEAGPTASGRADVAMGLAGALLVRPVGPAPPDEALVFTSEVDRAYAGSANPVAADLTAFRPTWWLINGAPYAGSSTPSFEAHPGVALRLYHVNAGLREHAIGVLGLGQRMQALDGRALAHPYSVVAETVAPGSTMESVVAIPASAPAGARYALYDQSKQNANDGAATNGSATVGGMLRFVQVAGTGATCPAANGGPLASGVAATPATTRLGPVTLTSAVSTATGCGGNVLGAEYFIDIVGADASGTAMGGAFGSPTVAVSATLSAGVLAGLTSGVHTLYVHGRDASGTWGPLGATTLNLDKTGPTVSGLSLDPSDTNGTVAVALDGTADDGASGGAATNAAEYFIDVAGAPGSGTALSLTPAGQGVASDLTATIAAPTVAVLTNATHQVLVRARDAFGNWGPVTSISLLKDALAPTASGVVVAPNPNNGFQSIDLNSFEFQVDATVTDTLSPIRRAEGYIDTPPARGNGFGFVFVPVDGSFNSLTEAVRIRVPLGQLQALPDGVHNVYVRAQDVAGNWGAATPGAFTIARPVPIVGPIAARRRGGVLVLTAGASGRHGARIVRATWRVGRYHGRAVVRRSADGITTVVARIPIGRLSSGRNRIAISVRDRTGATSQPRRITFRGGG